MAKYKFRLTQGRHTEGKGPRPMRDRKGDPILDENGNQKLSEDTRRYYKAGDIIETDHDLDKMFNVPSYPRKFEPVPGGTPPTPPALKVEPLNTPPRDPEPVVAPTVSVPPTEFNINQMTPDQLKELAVAKGVDIESCGDNKQKILSTLRAAGVR